jgi:hypothetical protein
LILAKVVDDILLAGSSADTQSFYTALNSRFKVGRFVCNAFIFNGLHIPQGDDFSIQFNINGFLGMCLLINLLLAANHLISQLNLRKGQRSNPWLEHSISLVMVSFLKPAMWPASYSSNWDHYALNTCLWKIAC